MPNTTTTPTTTPSLLSPNKKKLRFRRRRSSSSCSPAPTPTYSRSFSSASSLSLESSPSMTNNQHSCSTGSSSKPKKRSLLSRIILRSPKTDAASKSKATPTRQVQVSALPDSEDLKKKKSDHHNDSNNTNQQNHHHNNSMDDHSSSNDTLITTQVYEEAFSLSERGRTEQEAGQLKSAVATLEEALSVAQDVSSSCSEDWNCLYHKTLCQLISLYIQLDQLDEAAALLAQLRQSSGDFASFLEATPVLVDLLMHHSWWSLALEIANKLMPAKSTELGLLQLARLHLENALLQDEQHLDNDENDKSPSLQHLSECHQLLLSCSENVDKDTYLDLWQELAQAYSMRGEEDLALGCIQSRLQHLTSPTEVALAHYEQALHVYAPVEQHDMALTEAGIAVDILEQDNDNNDEHKEETEEEKTLLLLKLYQFKADVLCRLGRLNESIDHYDTLLQAYLKSTSHGPADAANICYILGKLCVRAKRFESAIAYFEQELELTRSVVGSHHLAISKILHELARVADAGLMEYERSLQYLSQALSVESAVCKQLQKQGKNKSLLQDAKNQIADTKRCLGKLHFKMGDFDTALKTTLAVEK